MAAPKTVITFDLDGSNKDFEVPFEYLARKFVVVTLIGTDRRVLTFSTEYRFTQRTIITTTQSWGPADGYERIEIRRLTSATERLVDFSDGSVLRAYDLNISNVQSLHIAEEGRDIATDTIGVDNDGNLDARGRKVVNLADGVEPGDAVTVRQQLANSESAMASAVAAVNAKNAAETARNQSQAAATTSGEKAVLSATEAEKSRLQAVIATDAVASIGTSVGEAAASASAANNSKLAAKVSEDNSKVSETNSKASELAAKDAEVASRRAGVQLGMSMWGFRPQPFQGFALDDGQELERALYPDFAAALDAGLLPVVSQALWDSVPANRACFVANSSTGKFRMRDLNGVTVGSLVPGGAFLRGGAGGSLLKADQFQGHSRNWQQPGSTSGGNTFAPTAVTSTGSVLTIFPTSSIGSIITDGVNGTPRVGAETFPTHATGAWMTRLYGLITPLGSAEASSLATAYASMASRVSVLEAANAAQVVYDTGFVTHTASTLATFTHNLPAKAVGFTLTLQCRVANNGFSVGDQVAAPVGLDSLGGLSAAYGVEIRVYNATQFEVYTGGAGIRGMLLNKGNTALFVPLASQWDLRIRARAA